MIDSEARSYPLKELREQRYMISGLDRTVLTLVTGQDDC